MRSTVTLGDISESTDFLIELYNLRRAYFDLDVNFATHRYQAEIVLESAVAEAIYSQQKEVDHWKFAWEQDNKFYDTFWFGAGTMGTIVLIIMFLVN